MEYVCGLHISLKRSVFFVNASLIHCCWVTLLCKLTRSSLVQIMAGFLICPNHYLNQCLHTIIWTFRNTLQWNLDQYTTILFTKNICKHHLEKMAAILSQPQCIIAYFIGTETVMVCWIPIVPGTAIGDSILFLLQTCFMESFYQKEPIAL